MRQRVWRRLLALVLALSTICAITAPAAAAGRDLESYDAAMLRQLTAIAGDASKTPEEKLARLIELGLITRQDLDEAGRGMGALNIDGREMTLEDIRQMLAQPGLDLSQTVTVEGTTVALENLKTIVEIEDQIQAFADSFVDPEELDPQFKAAYDSILRQMRSGGIALAGSGVSGLPAPGDGTSVAYDHSLRVQLAGGGVYEAAAGDRRAEITFTLSKPASYGVSFDYRTADGSAVAGVNYTEQSGTVVFAPGDTTKTIIIELADNQALMAGNAVERWSGNKTFTVQLNNIKNALFSNEQRAATAQVDIISDYQFDNQVKVVRHDAKISYSWDSGSSFPIELQLSESETSLRDTCDGGGYEGWKLPNNGEPTTIEFLFSMPSDEASLKKIRECLENGTIDCIRLNMVRDGGEQAEHKKTARMMHENDTGSAEDFFVWETETSPGAGIYIPLDAKILEELLNGEKIRVIYQIYFSAGQGLDFYGVELCSHFAFSYQEAKAAPGTYELGQLAPVTASVGRMSQRSASSVPQAVINGKTIPTAQKEGAVSNRFTYLYEISEDDASVPYLSAASFKGGVGYGHVEGQNEMFLPENANGGQGWKFTDATISFPRERAVVSIQPDQPSYAPAGEEGFIEIRLNTEYSQWLEANREALKVSVDGGATFYDLDYKRVEGAAQDDALITTEAVQFPANEGAEAKTIRAELFTEDRDAAGHYSLLTGVFQDITIRGAQYPTAISIDESCYPAGMTLYFRNPPVMKAITTPAADTLEPTPAVRWTSDNPEIADIHPETGAVYPKKEGEVTFTAATTGRDGELTAVTGVLTVKDGGEPFLEAPAEITASIQTDVTVAWSTNVIYKNAQKDPPEQTEFTVQILDQDGKLIYKDIVVADEEQYKTSAAIPGRYLTEISPTGQAAYTAVISCKDPFSDETTLRAQSKIVTRALPAVARLEGLDRYFITDENADVRFEAAFQNVDATNGLTYQYKVLKNGQLFDQQSESGYKGLSKRFGFEADQVAGDRLRDIYIVSIEVNNPGDSPSADSFILYVYRRGSMDISVDGGSADSLILNNNLKQEIAKTTIENIAELREKANLKSIVSIRREGLSWSNVDDQIAWESSDNEVVSVNYRQNGFYSNIENYDYASYRPSSEFMLAGLGDGEAVVTATHAKTGEQTQVDVSVTTLRDKLYVFNFFPRRKTVVEYTNGSGEKKKLETNDQGEIAIYEEKGIASDLELSSGQGDSLYLGVLHNQKLVSSEGDPSRLELYPVNIFKLKPASKIELDLITESGGFYEGKLSVSGAVYKNNKICPETVIKDQEFVLGEYDYGRLVVRGMNPDKFYTDEKTEILSPSDQLDYVFIARSEDDVYYPLYIKVDGSVSADDSVAFAKNAMMIREVPEGRANKPFVSSISARLPDVSPIWSPVLDYHGILGVSDAAPEMELNTTVLWWGEETEGGDYTVQIEDEYGRAVRNQKVSAAARYPFSDIAVSENVLIFNEETADLEPGDAIRPKIKLKKSGRLALAQDAAFTLMNAVGLPNIETDAGLQQALDDMLKDRYGTDVSDPKYSEGGEMVNPGTKKLMGSLDAAFDKLGLDMLLQPTNDPTVWKFFIEVGGDFMGDGKSENKIMIDQAADKTNFLPGPLDAYRMLKGAYKENEMNNLKEALKTGTGKEASYGAKLGGFYEGVITLKNGKWEMQTRSGGFTYGGAAGYTWSVNTMVGPIPVTASASIGGGLEMDHKILMTAHGSGDNKEYLQNLLVTMRINAYVKAFIGIGFDLSVLALKFGVFGQVDVSNYNMFLDYRTESGSLKSINGQKVNFTGKVGIEFYLKILFIKYRKILASSSFTAAKAFNKWDEIVKWQQEANFPSDFGGYDSETAAMMMALSSVPEFETLAEGMYMEDRNYLELAERVWGRPEGGVQPFALDEDNKLENLQSNAYPYANPLLSNDGDMAVFLSDGGSADLDMTRAEYTLWSENGYQAPKAIDDSPYADSNLQFADGGDIKIAVWQRQSKNLSFEPGQEATEDDLNAMMNASEICAAIYDEADDSWNTVRLTENGMADMAPVVATNGEKAAVIWRRVASSSTENVAAMDFDARNDLLCKVWDGRSWSEEKIVYNGASGGVKGLSAAMNKAGDTIIVYAIDSSSYVGQIKTAAFAEEQQAQKLDIVYGMIDRDGELTCSTIFLTKDEYLDENPQTATVMLDGEERFIAAWYTQRPLNDLGDSAAVSDIQLRAINSDGSLYENFIEGINEINNNASVVIGNQFRFAKSDGKDINDLALVWIAPEMEYLEATDPGQADMDGDSVYALRFHQQGEGEPVYISAAIPIVSEEENHKIDHVDAYLPQGGDAIYAALQTTAYDLTDPNLQERVELDEKDSEGKPIVVVVATPISAMKTAAGKFKNSVKVSDPIFDYGSARHDNLLPVQLTVTNQGVDLIDRISIVSEDEGGGNEQVRVFEDLGLAPNASRTLTIYHPLAGEEQLIQNIRYSVSATFSGEQQPIQPTEGLAETQIPDIGINDVRTTKESRHQRDIQFELYNQSDIELERLADQGYRAYIGFYTDNLCSQPASNIDVVSYEEISALTERHEFEIPKDKLRLIDNGALICNFRYSLPRSFEEGDQTLYVKVWVEKDGVEIAEAYPANNVSGVTFTDPTTRSGAPLLLSSELSADESGNTIADVTVKNLSWDAISADDASGGNLIVTLVDGAGNPLETQQSLLNDGRLLRLAGEDETTRTFRFSQAGADVRLSYAQVNKSETDATLSALTIGGAPLKFDRDTLTYETSAENLFQAEIMAAASNPDAVVTAKCVPSESGVLLTSERGALSGKLPLELGKNDTITQNRVELTVTSPSGASQTYTVAIANKSVNRNKAAIEIPAFMNQGGEKNIAISLNESEFEGTPTSFVIQVDGGEKSAPIAWNGGAGAKVNLPDTEGVHSIVAEVQDDRGFVTTATANVLLDKTAPTIDEQSLRFEETDEPLIKSSNDAELTAPSEAGVAANRQLKAHFKASDALSGLERATAKAGGREYEAVKNEDGSYTVAIAHRFQGTLTIVAYDRAGNSSEISREINLDDAISVKEVRYSQPAVSAPEPIEATLVGSNLELAKEIIVEATCGDEIVRGKRAGDSLTFLLEVFNADTHKEKRYDVVVTVDGVRQTLPGGTPQIILPKAAQPQERPQITAFALPGQLSSAINGDTITVTMPRGKDLTALIPEITFTPGAVITPALGQAVDFSKGAAYTLTLGSDAVTYQIVVTTEAGDGGGGGGGGAAAVYTVTFDTQGGDKIASVRVTSNQTVGKPKEPVKAGYTFGGWFTDKACLTAYDFNTKVTGNITLYAKWIQAEEKPAEPGQWKNPFADVSEKDWFYKDVEFAAKNGLFNGIEETVFAPHENLTRGMLVTALYRAEGRPSLENENLGYPFADVDAESWYGDAVYWARMNGIVKGYSDEAFAPNEPISREQIAAILERYGDFKGIAAAEKGDLSVFSDALQISDWARASVEWAVGAGLVNGKGDGVLDPRGHATRAEAAAMLRRFLEANLDDQRG